MRISNISRESDDGLIHLSARYEWEDSNRPPQEIYIRYGAGEEYFDDRSIGMPFLIAAVVPALRRGERRIALEGQGACPWLVDNLNTFMGYMANWYWYKYDRSPSDLWLPELEAAVVSPRVPSRRRTACFYSGGVDSLYSLRRNRSIVPRNDPGSVRDAIFVHGFDMGTRPAKGTEEDVFNSIIDSMQPLIESEDLNLIPVFTNMRSLDKDTDCWLDEYMASAMSAVAHGLVGQLSDVLVASSYEIPKIHPFACHPMTEPRLSSYGLRVNHDGELLSRVDRVKMIAEWPEAMQTLRVCFFGDTSELNCGKCAKCVRTKLELICAGKLDQASTLPGGAPTANDVRKLLIIQHDTLAFMDTLEAGLRQVGRNDLADAVKGNRWRYKLHHSCQPQGWVKYLDEKVLKGALKRRIVANRDKTF